MRFKDWLVLAALFAACFVALGAGAAHGLKGRLSPQGLDWVETAVRYGLWHALALLSVAWLIDRLPGSRLVNLGGFAFTLGMVLFCGGLVALAWSENPVFAQVVPFGGLAFILGWLCLALAGLRAGSGRP